MLFDAHNPRGVRTPTSPLPARSLLVQRRDEEIARLAAENERLAANAMTDDVKQRLRDLEEENASLLEEVRKLRAALRQMTAVSLRDRAPAVRDVVIALSLSDRASVSDLPRDSEAEGGGPSGLGGLLPWALVLIESTILFVSAMCTSAVLTARRMRRTALRQKGGRLPRRLPRRRRQPWRRKLRR